MTLDRRDRVGLAGSVDFVHAMRWAPALVLASALGCSVPATEILVTFDTDAPVTRAVSVHVVALAGNVTPPADAAALERDGGASGSFRRGDGGSLHLPASFAVVPAAGESHSASVTLLIDVDFGPIVPGGAITHMRRTARVSFVPDATVRLPIFLPLACANATSGCTSVSASQCTQSTLCHDRGETCGNDGTCVPVEASGGMDAGFDATSCATGTRCGSVCADLQTDPAHCGACDTACPSASGGSAACVHGSCSLTCPTGRSLCGSVCVDLQADVQNCGTCGTVCTASGGTPACSAGACSVSCPGGQAYCGGTCRDVQSDVNNCGSCGHTCPSASGGGASCSSDQCGYTCPGGSSLCGSACHDLSNDANNCGSCGHACNPSGGVTRSCSGGRCVPDCSGRVNGYYCGNDLVGGNANTIYFCSGGVATYAYACPNGCRVEPAGTNDNCNANCSGRVDGLYCGNDLVGGDPNTLYLCSGGSYSVSQFCTAGCQIEPAGTNDMCR